MIPSEEQTLELLRQEKQITIKIKTDKNNSNYVTERVYVNGACIQIPVGEDIAVPETVYELLKRREII